MLFAQITYVSFEKPSQKLVLRVSSGLRPRAFICFLVFGTPDKTLALVFDILHESMFQAISASHPFTVVYQVWEQSKFGPVFNIELSFNSKGFPV